MITAISAMRCDKGVFDIAIGRLDGYVIAFKE